MKTYDMICPVCGHENHNLYLEETDGWMECEKCGQDTRNIIEEPVRISMFDIGLFKNKVVFQG